MIIGLADNEKIGILNMLCALFVGLLIITSCNSKEKTVERMKEKTAEMILGDSSYQAISYGGYRAKSREIQPTIVELKEDMKILSAMGIKLIRTYNVTLPHAANVLRAIAEIKAADNEFEMYVMLGAWIDCKGAWTDQDPDHEKESEKNEVEILRAAALAKQYPDIVKIIAVGNEAMVKWATAYYVQPDVVLKWVNHLQELKARGELPAELWVTSSDNFASWGGGSEEYHVPALNQLIEAVDFISMHTYPMHDTHYNPEFWNKVEGDINNDSLQIQEAMRRARNYAQDQFVAVESYVRSLGLQKPIHIGETGWASHSKGLYGPEGSRACDEYKEGIYYRYMREWTNRDGISCFYFEAFDEPWKDAGNPDGSENHFGLFTKDGYAKYAIWDWVDRGVFAGLKRGDNMILKTYEGQEDKLMKKVKNPFSDHQIIKME